ncbi:hypothetical protein A2U01_0107650, partial [Trifolium medium]|nr:hypothetical protein [Trifolium medium]
MSVVAAEEKCKVLQLQSYR